MIMHHILATYPRSQALLGNADPRSSASSVNVGIRSGASGQCVPKRSLGTRIGIMLALAGWFALPAHSQAQIFKDPGAPYLRSNPAFLKAFKEAVAKPSESTVRIQCDGKDTAL